MSQPNKTGLNLMACTNCGSEISPGQKFCMTCGAQVTTPCPRCSTDVTMGQAFCAECGLDLRQGLTDDRPVATERRVVSVLFVDLVGFTTLSEGRDHEDVRALATTFFESTRQIIERFGGTVDKYIGDAVMAWWGATTSQEDDAERAVRAALEIVDQVGPLGVPLGIPELKARAGVMTGEVSVGPGGNERGLLLGDLVNSASRVQSLAEPDQVLVGNTTADLVVSAIDLAEASSHQVKGREEPIVVRRALRPLAERGGRGRSGALEPPFVGRTSELRLLKDLVHNTGADRRARMVSLVGQAGIGKSRLVWELRKYVDGLVETVYWHVGRSPSYGDGIALWALAEMIRHRAGISESDDAATAKRLLGEAISEHVPDETQAGWITERLDGLLGVGETGGDRSELFAAARAFFEHLARKGTTVLVFEDLQWADPSLLEFVEDLTDWSQNHPILVVTMTRPELLERRPDWGSGRPGLTSLYIGPLSDDEMTELIEGTDPDIGPDHTARIVAAAGGVPLFAVELLRMVLDEGSGAADEIPTSVQQVISARLDRLSPEGRELARDASVLGHSFTIDAMGALREEDADKLERLLAGLVRREILELVHDPLSPEQGQYRWVQGLVREVTYGRIGREDRRHLHLVVARYIRDLDDPSLAPIAASHYLLAGEGTPDPDIELEMVETLERAIDRARSVHAHEQVLALIDTALEMVPTTTQATFHEMGANAAVPILDFETAQRHLDRLVALADTDPIFLHRAVALRAMLAVKMRHSELVVDDLIAHLDAHPNVDDDPDLARVGVYTTWALMLRGDTKGVIERGEATLDTLERLDMTEEIAQTLISMGTLLTRSRFHHGLALLRGALEMSRRLGLSQSLLRALINIGSVSEPDEALAVTRQAIEEARRVGDKRLAVFAITNLLEELVFNLDLDEADEILQDPLLTNLPHAESFTVIAGRAQLELYRGRRPQADKTMAEARLAFADIGDPQLITTMTGLEHEFLLFDLDFERVYGELNTGLGDDVFFPGLMAADTMRAATLSGRPDWVEQAVATVEEMPLGLSSEATLDWGRGVLATLNGNVDAGVASIDRAAAGFVGKRLRWSVQKVAVLTSGARLLPAGHPDRDRLIAEARELTESAGAHGLADWIDRAVSVE